MNSIDYSTNFTILEKFDRIFNRLAQDRRHINLDQAIICWSEELALEKDFPNISQEIIANKDIWIQHHTIVKIALKLYLKLLVVTDRKTMGVFGNLFNRAENISSKDFYHNIQEMNKEMTIKSVIFVAFILTGVGLLIYLLNKKDKNNNPQSNIYSNTDYKPTTLIKEKYILVLRINSDGNQELLDSLTYNHYLRPADSLKLYRATQDLWIENKNKFDSSKIKDKLDNQTPVTITSEYDVHFVMIELDKNDFRFHPNVNQMDRHDAFIELADSSPQVKVSPRLSYKAYENTEFYSR
ncbi:hypothetical protein NIES4102_25990 [Chondrocystis sp. NIES-4102]|nr:hypothetical protein NIES4102_25990 [Chondrocystis sp. NIES-4102]